MMQMLQNGPHSGKSSIFFLPMLDLNPGDMSCVYSTLRFIASQAQMNNVTPIMTFDQPLYLKALTVISSKHADSDLKSIILCLGTSVSPSDEFSWGYRVPDGGVRSSRNHGTCISFLYMPPML